MDSKKLGILGERIAADYLKRRGYKILDRNYKKKWKEGPMRGEIDIVAKPRRSIFDILWGRKNNIIHFIEVKTISGSKGSFFPEEKVDFLKQRKIKKLAEIWLREKKISLESKWQIDVIGIFWDYNSKKARISHFKNTISED